MPSDHTPANVEDLPPFDPKSDPDFVARAESVLYTTRQARNAVTKLNVSNVINILSSVCKYAFGYSRYDSFVSPVPKGPAVHSHSTLNVIVTASVITAFSAAFLQLIHNTSVDYTQAIERKTRSLFDAPHPSKESALRELRSLETTTESTYHLYKLATAGRYGRMFSNARDMCILFPNYMAGTTALLAVIENTSESTIDDQNRPRIQL